MSRPINLQRRMTTQTAAPALLAVLALALVAIMQVNNGRPILAAAAAVSAIAVGVASVLSVRRTAAEVHSVVDDAVVRSSAILGGGTAPAPAEVVIEELEPVNQALDTLSAQQRILREQSEALEAGEFDDPVLDAHVPGSVGNVIRGSVDILRSAGEQLRDFEAVNASLMDNVSDAVVVVDQKGRIVASNAVAKVALDLFGGSLEQTLPSWWDLPNGDHDFSRPLADGSLTLTQLSKTQMVTADGAVTMLLWRDVSGERAVQAQIANVARTDIVTGLPNRHGLLVAYDRLVELGRSASVIHVDLEDFGRINQRHGFAAGDHVLNVLSDRLGGVVRDGDTVARISGDEFVFLLDSQGDVVERLAQRVLDAIAEPVELRNGVRISLGAHAGWSSGTADASHELLRQANYALGAAKERDQRVAEYDDDVAQRDSNWRDWEQQLSRAIAHDEFVLFGQPILDIVENQVVGLEVFLRWQHPSGRLISPGEFIAIAEESELITDIDRWVIRRCVAEARRSDPNLVFSMNVSNRFMADKQMSQFVQDTLAEHDLPAGRIQIDVTETNVATDVAGVIESIRSLNEMGVKVALDDFGTGYSSLAHLLKLAISTIKIDGRMVNTVTEPEGRGVIAAIIAFARKRGLAVVAEGVESEQEVGELAELGCNYQQGFFHAMPAPLAEVLHWLGTVGAPEPVPQLPAPAPSSETTTTRTLPLPADEPDTSTGFGEPITAADPFADPFFDETGAATIPTVESEPPSSFPSEARPEPAPSTG